MKNKAMGPSPVNPGTLTLCDFALFLSVMKVKEAYQCTLSIIMNDADMQLVDVKTEEVILNKKGFRAIRLDAWAVDDRNCQYDMEMQNDTEHDDVRKRSRFYQGLIDTPLLKAGAKTKYKELPGTVIIFITQEDIFGCDRAMYTFTEQCEEIHGLHLEDGTKKIFLNMSSKNGRAELVNLLQYMKDGDIDALDSQNPDERIRRLDEIVTKVKESEEWEVSNVSIYKTGIEAGKEIGSSFHLIEMITRKLRKNKPPEIIAEDLEEDIEVVKSICKVAGDFAPEYDVEQIYLAWKTEV